MCTLRGEAARYADLGWRVVPVAGKVPRVFWKERSHPDQFDHLWDDPETTGIAVVLGQPSDGLIARDFDEVESYQAWCDEQSELAAELPTAQTPRPGRHVFAYCQGRCPTRRLRDGELRGDDAVVVLPPSAHPSGKPYAWMTDPYRPIPTIDPSVLVGAAQRAREPDPSPQEGDSVNTCSKHMACVNSDKLLFIDWAIEETRPTGPGQRNRRVFDFARYLRTVYDKATDPDALRCHVEDWHRAALPYIRTKDFGATWADFINAWDSVEMPAGATLAMVERMANEDSFTLGLGDMNLDKVARLLRAAAVTRGEDGVFFMDFRTMGRCVGLSAVTARNITLKLVAQGHLIVVEKGAAWRRGKATVWRWIDP
jgi:hypothetical protein